MKFFLVEGENLKDIDLSQGEGKQILDAHIAFLHDAVEKGIILFNGPKPTGGGVLIAKGESLEELQEFFAQDPFIVAGINSRTFTEFFVKDGQDFVKPWFDK